MKGVMRFGKKGKLSPRYVGPYQISKRIGFVVSLETVAVKDSLSYEERFLIVKLEAYLHVLGTQFRFSASRSRLDRFSISSSAESVERLDGLSRAPQPVKWLGHGYALLDRASLFRA
ncbi:hypothetical protein MTR67_035043 [Solanum verrucosum]|uniref:Tf2-1-like SH3-like domain-containing protein n=1 Tax=Solanum verrucosum TaxID=315347 RepID=A0AAF0ZL34_SOLVR|nr:hypothetical protein MTR67_035043 [Solanum verrucosum]